MKNIFVDNLRNNSIETRLRMIVLACTDEKRRFSTLEAGSEVSAGTWRTWWTRGNTPSGALVEGAAKIWPEYAYWLTTGCTDIRCGHDMPDLAPEAKGYLSNWPEEATVRNKKIGKTISQTYLKGCIELAQLQEKKAPQNRLKFQHLTVTNREREKEIIANFEIELAYEEKYFQ